MTNAHAPAQPLILITAGALVDAQNRVLVQKRPAGKPLPGLWEFPGGKIEALETGVTALCRELEEELGVHVSPTDLQPFAFAWESQRNKELLLLLYVTHCWSGVPQPLIADELRWCTLPELRALEMPPADVPLVNRLGAIL